jgi:flagellar biosynthesis protein FliR
MQMVGIKSIMSFMAIYFFLTAGSSHSILHAMVASSVFSPLLRAVQ